MRSDVSEPEASDREVGWHPNDRAGKYRYWDGSTFAFSATPGELKKYASAETKVPGVDFTAPLHGTVHYEPSAEERKLIWKIVAVGAAAVALVVGAIVYIVTVGVPGVAWLVLIVAGLAALMWAGRHEYAGEQRARAAARETDARFREAGLMASSDAPPRCPKCGGTQFKLRRTGGQRAAIGTATVLFGLIGAGAGAAATNQQVQCVTCGLFYSKVQ